MLADVLYNPAVLVFLQIMLMIIFLGGAWSTLRERDTFEGVIYNYRILPGFMVQPASYGLPIAEILTGLGLATAATRPYAAVGAVILLALFNIAIGVNLKRGRREIDCGCFSSVLKQHLSAGLMLRNGALMVVAIWLAWIPSEALGSSAEWLDWYVGFVAATVVAIIYIMNASLTAIQKQRRQSTPHT